MKKPGKNCGTIPPKEKNEQGGTLSQERNKRLEMRNEDAGFRTDLFWHFYISDLLISHHSFLSSHFSLRLSGCTLQAYAAFRQRSCEERHRLAHPQIHEIGRAHV